MNFKSSLKYLNEAEKYIPLGAQTFSKSKLVYPKKFSPLFISEAKGSNIWDVDGNKFIDLVNGLLPVILGYQNQNVDSAIRKQLKKGITFSLSSPLEIKLSKLLCEIIPSAEMVRFAKNGSDATSACIRLARAYTKKDYIICCGYHGWQDWYIGTTSRDIGVPKVVKKLSLKVKYNDLDSIEKVIKKYKGKIAAMIMEPSNFEKPDKNYFRKLQLILKKYNILLIFDEICTGFRMSIGGAQEFFNIKPDLSAFGKGMANGMPISAVVGKKKIMKYLEKVFFSTTFSGETLSIVSAIETINLIKKKNVVKKIWEKGNYIKSAVKQLIHNYELENTISIKGYAPWTSIQFKEKRKSENLYIKSLFIKEMLGNGILINSTNNISYSLTKFQLNKIVRSYDKTFKVISEYKISKKKNKLLNENKVNTVFKIR